MNKKAGEHDCTKPDIRAISDARRAELGISEYKLAQDTHLPAQTVYDFYRRKSKQIDTLERILSALGLTIAPARNDDPDNPDRTAGEHDCPP